MKIAIIGGGFYGCYIANRLGKTCTVDVFEKLDKPCSAAILNNQNRLHLGYHYPRCEKTIAQTVKTYNAFLDKFGSCVSFVDNNIYAVHEDSKVSFLDYCETFDKYKLPHSIVKKNDPIWNKVRQKSAYQGAVRTTEGVINCSKLVDIALSDLYANKNVTLTCNANITAKSLIDLQLRYDYVINCTYNQPFLGITNPPLQTKSEKCLIAVMRDRRFADLGFTIMDGPFCSLYPLNRDMFTVSSVLHTPIPEKQKFNVKKQLGNILEHASEYFDLSTSTLVNYYYGTKTKIANDKNSERYSFVTKNSNIVTVFSGKISSVIESCEEVINAIT
jgi:hypothetical protein